MLHSLISSSQPYSILVLVSTLVALLLYGSSVCACACTCSEQSVSVTETKELCVSVDVSRRSFTFPYLFFSPQEDVVKSSCMSVVSFRQVGLLLQHLYLSTPIYFSTDSLDSCTKNHLQVQPVCSCITPSDSYRGLCTCSGEGFFFYELSTRAQISIVGLKKPQTKQKTQANKTSPSPVYQLLKQAMKPSLDPLPALFNCSVPFLASLQSPMQDLVTIFFKFTSIFKESAASFSTSSFTQIWHYYFKCRRIWVLTGLTSLSRNSLKSASSAPVPACGMFQDSCSVTQSFSLFHFHSIFSFSLAGERNVMASYAGQCGGWEIFHLLLIFFFL